MPRSLVQSILSSLYSMMGCTPELSRWNNFLGWSWCNNVLKKSKTFQNPNGFIPTSQRLYPDLDPTVFSTVSRPTDLSSGISVTVVTGIGRRSGIFCILSHTIPWPNVDSPISIHHHEGQRVSVLFVWSPPNFQQSSLRYRQKKKNALPTDLSHSPTDKSVTSPQRKNRVACGEHVCDHHISTRLTAEMLRGERRSLL